LTFRVELVTVRDQGNRWGEAPVVIEKELNA
jgi:hypothetical protein